MMIELVDDDEAEQASTENECFANAGFLTQDGAETMMNLGMGLHFSGNNNNENLHSGVGD